MYASRDWPTLQAHLTLLGPPNAVRWVRPFGTLCRGYSYSIHQDGASCIVTHTVFTRMGLAALLDHSLVVRLVEILTYNGTKLDIQVIN